MDTELEKKLSGLVDYWAAGIIGFIVACGVFLVFGIIMHIFTKF